MLPPPVPPICLLSLTIPPIHHSPPFHPLNPSFYRSHPSPTLSPLRTTPLNPSFCGNPCVMKMVIFAVILVTKTKVILFTVISMTKIDDFVCGNLYDEEKDDCLTFFEGMVGWM